MAPPSDAFSPPGAAAYDSDTMSVGDGTWDASRNTFLLPNLQGLNFDTMQYNGMANRFSTLAQYHRIVLAHGIVAALVFLLIVPMSVMTARFYSRQPGFAVVYHAQLHVLAGLMLLAVFILGYFAVGPARSLTNPHHGIGVAIFVLFILQLLGGRLVRHITKIRSLRITIHQWCGRAIALLGIVQVPLGLTLYGSPRYLFVLYTLWMVFLVIIYFIMSYRSAERRELYMSGARSEAGRTRITESEYFSADPSPHQGGWTKWLGPLAAGAGIWALLRGRNKDPERERERHRDRSRSRSRSPSYHQSRRPEAVPSRRESDSYMSEKYPDLPRQRSGGGGLLKALGGAAAAVGAGKLVSGFVGRQNRHDEEYSAVSTETPRRHRSGRGGAPARSELSSEVTDNLTRDPRDGTNTSLWPPSADPANMAGARNAAARPVTPRPMHARDAAGTELEDSDYSSYVSPSRRPVEGRPGGGFAKGILSGLGMGWFANKMADRRARRREEDRLREEEDMRSGTQGTRFTGDGYPSPSRRNGPRPPVRRPTGYGRGTELSEMTESSVDTRPGPSMAPSQQPGAVPVPGGHSSRPRSRHDMEHVSMPAMPPDPGDILRPGPQGLHMSSADNRRPRRPSPSRLQRAEERAAARAGGSAAANEERVYGDERERRGSQQSQPVSVRLKVHDDRDRNVTLRRLTEEEAMAAQGPRGGGDGESSMSGLESPSYGQRYRRDASRGRDTSQGRAQQEAEREAERRAEEEDRLAPLSPPQAAFARGGGGGGGRRGKDSAYYSGAAAAAAGGQTAASSLGSPESHGTWSQMSMSPSGGERGADSAAAEDRRRRRRQERRAAASGAARPSGQDMYE